MNDLKFFSSCFFSRALSHVMLFFVIWGLSFSLKVVLELQEDGTAATCDDPKVVLGSMPHEFLQQVRHFYTHF